MSRLSLNPVAAPVDRFAAPEVRQGTAGSEALQLAGALQRFNPALEDFVMAQHSAWKQASEAEAAKIMAERQFKSMTDYRAAVDRGEIPEDANPWRTVFLKNMVARRQLTDLSASLEDQILQNPELRDDDTGERVANFIDTQLKSASKDFDAFQMPAAMAQADQLRGQAVERHLARRREVRAEMTQESITRSVATALDTNRNTLAALADAFDDGDLADTAQVDAILGDVQRMIGAAELSGVSDKDLKKWVASTVANAAIREKSPELASLLMSRLKVGGESLSTRLAGTGLLEEIQNRVEDEADRSARRERETVAYARSEQYRSASLNIADIFNRGGITDEVDAYLKNPANQLTIEQQSRLRSEFLSLAGDRTVSEAFQQSMADPVTAKKLMEQAIKSGDVDMAKAYRQVYEWTNQGTTIDARLAIDKVKYADDQTFYNELQKWGQMGQLDSRDIGYILDDRNRVSSEYRSSLNERRQLIEAEVLDALTQAASLDDNGRISPAAGAAIESKARRASYEVFSQFSAWRNTPEGQAAGLEGMQRKIDEIAEKAYAKTLGLSDDQIKSLPVLRDLNLKIAAGEPIEMSSVLPVSEDGMVVYRMNVNGTPAGRLSGIPKLFRSPAEVDSRAVRVGTEMGLKDADLVHFVSAQHAAARDEQDAEIYMPRAYDMVYGPGSYAKGLTELTETTKALKTLDRDINGILDEFYSTSWTAKNRVEKYRGEYIRQLNLLIPQRRQMIEKLQSSPLYSPDATPVSDLRVLPQEVQQGGQNQ